MTGPAAGRPDAIVVGAGIAGMMAASELASRGRRVLVLEHNHQAGGLMAGIRRDGFYFDAGCQSFENMGIVFPLLERYGLGGLARFRRARYRIKMPDIDTVVESLAQTRGAFKRAYPRLAAGFDKVFDEHESTAALIGALFVPEAVPYVRRESPWASAAWLVRALPWAGRLKRLLLDDSADWYRRLIPCDASDGPGALLARCGYTRMNVFVASAFWHLWAEDYWYPEGGFQSWFDGWVKALEERGARFLFRRSVSDFEKAGDRATAVLTRQGERFEADQVVYCGDYRRAVHRLIGDRYYGRAELSRLSRTRHSDAVVSVYLGLDLPPEKLKDVLKSSHVLYFPGYDCKTALDLADEAAHAKAFLEVSAHCIDDPGLNAPGRSSLVVQAFTQRGWLDGWKAGEQPEGIGEARRTPGYRDLKRRVAEELLRTLEGLAPGIGARVKYREVGSPLSAERFTGNHLGGTCGFELNWRNHPFLSPLARTRSPLRNVHMAGHFTVWPGAAPTAALSGKIAALRAHEALVKRPKALRA